MDLDCSPAALALALVLASGLGFARCLTLASVGQLRTSLSPTLPAPSAQLGLWWPIVGSKVERRLCDLPLQKLRGLFIENEEDFRAQHPCNSPLIAVHVGLFQHHGK